MVKHDGKWGSGGVSQSFWEPFSLLLNRVLIVHPGLKFVMIIGAQIIRNQLAILLDILMALFLEAPDMDGQNLKYRFWWTMWNVHLIQLIYFPAHVMPGVRIIVATVKMLFSRVPDSIRLILSIHKRNRSSFFRKFLNFVISLARFDKVSLLLCLRLLF